MILILAATADVTARRVSRWLRRAGVDVLQIDCDDPIMDLEITLDDDREEAALRSRSGRAFRLSEVDAFWYRRGELAPDPTLIGAGTAARARLQEWSAVHAWLLARLEAKPSLGSWEREERCTKLEQLGAARALGLRIPGTQISCDRAHLQEAIQRWPRAVSKAIQQGASVEENTTTTELRPDALRGDAPSRFFPRLVQERLERAIELRIFFLAGQIWTLAMIPRNGAAPPVDVRTAALDRSFHLVPYELPRSIRSKLERLMRALNLDTGSIDMIVSPEGRHTFLEVNPSGQLDWLARALNAPIERAIADHLLALARAGGWAENTPYEGVRGPSDHSLSPGRVSEAHRVPPHSAAVSAFARATPPSAGQARAASASAGAHNPDMAFVDAAQRFTWSRGQRVLVCPLEKPILRRFAVASRSTSGADERGRSSADERAPEAPRKATAEPSQPRSAAQEPLPRALSRRVPASVQLVEGSQGALLYDLQRGKAFAVPPGLAPRLRGRIWPHGQTEAERRWLSAAEDALGLELPAELADLLPQRSLAWENPAAITSAVIDVDERSEHHQPAILATIFAAIAEVGCEHALLRIQRADGLAILDRLLPLLEDGPPIVLELWMDAATVDTPELIARVARWPRITSVILFGASEAREHLSPRSGVGTILTRTEELDLGAPSPPTFAEMLVRDELFRESIDHHPAFHRKLAVGPDGEIRNAPGLSHSFGRLGARPLRDVIREPEFQRLGAIHRGLIAGCRECEFRRACTDSREPHLGVDGLYHHRTRCTLDPRHRATLRDRT